MDAILQYTKQENPEHSRTTSIKVALTQSTMTPGVFCHVVYDSLKKWHYVLVGEIRKLMELEPDAHFENTTMLLACFNGKVIYKAKSISQF